MNQSVPTMTRVLSNCLPIAIFLVGSTLGAEPQPLAHAHNDYEHSRPLLDALSHGFCSVEADVYEVDGALLVAHDREKVEPARTLQKLYLEPLRERVEANRGAVYKNGPRFTLLIDFKSEGKRTYEVLQKVLVDYREMLVRDVDGQRKPGAVSIVISGNRPFKMIEEDQERLVGIDGRLSDLSSKRSAELMPLISDNWRNHFRWRGIGEFPEQERTKLRGIVRQAHAAGRRVRFWATPESEDVWRELAAAGVDHLNTDQLGKLEAFLKKEIEPRRS